MKSNHPKRRKDKYNPYSIYEMNGKYYIEFIDGQRKKHHIEINEELYEMFNEFELDDLKYLNILDRHIEQSQVYEVTLQKRSSQVKKSIEDEVIDNILLEKLYIAIAKLPEKQRYRLILYYFGDLTYEQIAELEGCSFQSIAKSINVAKKKLKEFLE